MKRIAPSKVPKDFVFSFDRRLGPLATVTPGETIVVETLDNTGNLIYTPEYRKKGYWGPYNPITYPINIEGANKGDTLVIDIIEVKPIGGEGWMFQDHSTFATSSWIYPNLLDPVPRKFWFLPIKDYKAEFTLGSGQKMILDLKPMIGTIGTTPEYVTPWDSSMCPGEFGGNMDARNCCKGNRLYLPVFVEGALLGLGDVHALQGQGELGGGPIDCPSECTLKIDVIKDKTIPGPRIENDEYIMTVGNRTPLEYAIRIATVNLLCWVREEYGLDIWEDANMLLTLVDEIEINQTGAPIYSATVKWPKRYLPKKSA